MGHSSITSLCRSPPSPATKKRQNYRRQLAPMTGLQQLYGAIFSTAPPPSSSSRLPLQPHTAVPKTFRFLDVSTPGKTDKYSQLNKRCPRGEHQREDLWPTPPPSPQEQLQQEQHKHQEQPQPQPLSLQHPPKLNSGTSKTVSKAHFGSSRRLLICGMLATATGFLVLSASLSTYGGGYHQRRKLTRDEVPEAQLISSVPGLKKENSSHNATTDSIATPVDNIVGAADAAVGVHSSGEAGTFAGVAVSTHSRHGAVGADERTDRDDRHPQKDTSTSRRSSINITLPKLSREALERCAARRKWEQKSARYGSPAGCARVLPREILAKDGRWLFGIHIDRLQGFSIGNLRGMYDAWLAVQSVDCPVHSRLELLHTAHTIAVVAVQPTTDSCHGTWKSDPPQWPQFGEIYVVLCAILYCW